MSATRKTVTWEQTEQVIRSMRQVDPHFHPAVGSMTKVIGRLEPEEMGSVLAVANLYHHEDEMGRHGNKQRVLDTFEVDQDIADTVHDALQVDYVAAALQRRKSDADLPIPDLNRRDFLSAAFDAHSTPEQR